MKNRLTFLLIILLISNCFAQDAEKLPEIPWAYIAEMNINSNGINSNWKKDVEVKLVGFYSYEDSIIVLKAIEQLDSITETISIRFSQSTRGNLEIFFMDSTIYSGNGDYYISNKSGTNASSVTSANQSGRFYTRLYIDKKSIEKDHYENILWNKIACSFVEGYLSYDSNNQFAKDRNSIFNPIQDVKNGIVAHQGKLNNLDISIIKESYKKGYEEKLQLARNQYKPNIPFWVRVNPYVFLLLPLGVLVFLLLPLFMKVARNTSLYFKNKLLRFNFNGFIAVFVLTVVGFFYFILAYKFKWGHVSYPSLGFTMGIFASSLIIGLLTINLIRFIEILIHRNTHLKGPKLVLIFLSTVLIPFSAVLAYYHFLIKGDFSIPDIKGLSYIFLGGLIIGGFRALISYFFFKEKDLILENETKLSKLRELKSKAELNALHSRINPHFLYNSLNSIAGLAHDDADKTEHMALSLSKLFRYSINKEKSDWTTFKEELEMVRIYLDVEKVRFDDRLTYSVEIQKDLEEQQIPRFIIQPLVENAVKHGISKSVDGGDIKVSISKEGKNVVIAVSDSGPAFPDDLAPGFGIQSIYDKLEILYKKKFEMNFTNSPQKQVTLKLK